MNKSYLIVVALAGTVLVGGCGQGNQESAGNDSEATLIVSSDGPVYPAVSDLTANATLVVRGTVGELRATEIDDGGVGDTEGVPMVFFDFEIDDVLAGISSTNNIVVGWLDKSIDTSDLSELEEGDVVVMFLNSLTDTIAPGIDTETQWYIPLAGDNGVLDVVANNVVARSPSLTDLEGMPGGRLADEEEPLVATLAELEAVVEEYA